LLLLLPLSLRLLRHPWLRSLLLLLLRALLLLLLPRWGTVGSGDCAVLWMRIVSWVQALSTGVAATIYIFLV